VFVSVCVRERERERERSTCCSARGLEFRQACVAMSTHESKHAKSMHLKRKGAKTTKEKKSAYLVIFPQLFPF